MKNGEPVFTTSLVSVILPVYNSEAFITETLKSISSQTYRNLEIIVVDDGSTDKSADIIQAFQKKDQRIVLLHQSNQGVAAARNLAIEHFQGEFVAPIDADDLWSPEKIAKQVECIRQAGEACGLVYTWSVRIDEFGFVISEDRTDTLEGLVYPALAYCNFVGNGSVPLINRRSLEKVGYYDTQLKSGNDQGCEDWDLYFRIAEHYEYRVVPEFLMAYRHADQGLSSNFDATLKFHFAVIQKIKNKHPEIPKKIFRWSAANLYLYLARQNLLAKRYINSLIWWLKALRTDYAALVSFQIYNILIRIIFKLKTNSLLHNKIKYNQISQKQIHQKLNLKKRLTPSRIINIQRWKTINQLCDKYRNKI